MVQQSVDYWIAENNIAQFEKQIDSETDAALRKVLEGLLDREKLKLRGMRPAR